MNSRERIIAAMSLGEVDYLPLSIYFNPNLEVQGYDLRRWQEHVRLQKDLGGDPVVNLVLSNSVDGSVERKCWREDVEGIDYPVQFEEFKTPAGVLRLGVKVHGGWPVSCEAIGWGDETASNMYEPLIKKADDVEAFGYVHKGPGVEEIERAREINRERFEIAEKYECATVCHGGMGLATFMFTMGAENAVMFSIDNPDAFVRLAEIDHDVNIARIKAAAEIGADIIKRFGGYEQTNFYSPAQFRKIMKPLLKKEVQAAHEHGLKIYYRVVSGATPLLDDFADIGFDCVEGGEPRLDKACSFEKWADALKGKCCCWTGVSSPALLGGDDQQEVRKEVRKSVDVFGSRGFILGVTNSIRNHFNWKNTLAMIDEWKKVRV